MNEDRPVLSATALKPTECTFQHCVDTDTDTEFYYTLAAISRIAE